jgi:phosphatidylglycerol:prolipoprotein diacylglycerol transferase
MHPELLRIGAFSLPSYGVLVAIGILTGFFVALHLARKVGGSFDFVLDAVFWMVLSGLVGARLMYIIVEWQAFLEDPLKTLLGSGGQVYLGGLFTAVASLFIICKKYTIPMRLVADIFAPALALGHAFGRIGCFLAGCCYGAPTRSWFGVRFPRLLDSNGSIIGSWPFMDHLMQGLVKADDVCSLPVYPVQLFESAGNAIIFTTLLFVWRKRPFDGSVACLYLVLYGGMRFFLEFLRGDAIRGFWGVLSISQWLSLLMVASGTLLWMRFSHDRMMRELPCSSSSEK